MPRRPPDPRPPRAGAAAQRSGRPARPGPHECAADRATCGAALIAGAVLAAVFIAALIITPVLVLSSSCALLAIAGWRVLRQGHREGVSPGGRRRGSPRASVAPLAAYCVGDAALPLVIVFAFMAGALGFIGAPRRRGRPAAEHGDHDARRRVDRRPRFVRRADPALVEPSRSPWSGSPAPTRQLGTDTLFMVALGVVANDIGALVVGSASARRRCAPGSARTRRSRACSAARSRTFVALFIASKTFNDTLVDRSAGSC